MALNSEFKNVVAKNCLKYTILVCHIIRYHVNRYLI